VFWRSGPFICEAVEQDLPFSSSFSFGGATFCEAVEDLVALTLTEIVGLVTLLRKKV
jgi:hypothetical protein